MTRKMLARVITACQVEIFSVPDGNGGGVNLFHVATPDFPAWLQGQLDKWDMSPADLAREMGVQDATVSRILSGSRGVGKKTAAKIAAALKVDVDVVLYHAGYLTRDPEDPTQDLDPIVLEMLAMLEGKTDAQKRAALAALEALFESLDAGAGGRDRTRTR